jgi:hypothetical protein
MPKSVICTTYFSQKKHPNDPNDRYVSGRQDDGRVLQNSIKYIEPWYNSIKNLSLNGVVFYDNLDDDFINRYKTDFIDFVKVQPSEYSNNDWRFFCYREYFEKNPADFIFLSDGSDVTVVKDPSKIITDYPEIDIFVCKDSIKLYDFPYMQIHKDAKWDGLIFFLLNQHKFDLINMGVIGGRYNNIMDFLDKFCLTRLQLGFPDFNSDMWLGQYIFRYLMCDKNLLIGQPFTSVFKGYEKDRKDIYFIHK